MTASRPLTTPLPPRGAERECEEPPEAAPGTPRRLADCRCGERVRIVGIDAGQGAVLHLMSLGLDVGSVVEVRRRLPLHGPLLLVRDGVEVALGHLLAGKIAVEKA